MLPRRNVRGGVVERHDPALAGDADPLVALDPALRLRPVEEEHHRGALADRAVQLLAGLDGDHLRPRQQDLRLVARAVARLLDHLEGQAGRVRQLGDLLRVALGHGGGGGHGDRGGRSRGHHRRGNADELGDPGAGLLLQVGDAHEVPRGLLHRPDDLRRHQRPAEHGHRAHAVDDGLHAEARVDRACAPPSPAEDARPRDGAPAAATTACRTLRRFMGGVYPGGRSCRRLAGRRR